MQLLFSPARTGDQPVFAHSRSAFHTSALLALLAIAISSPALAQDSVPGNTASGIPITPTVRFLGGLFNVGGYYFTGSATRAIGTPKFAGDSQLFVRPKKYGSLLLTGGLEYVHASDHLLPFQSGNEFQLIGPAFRITTPRHIGKPRPFLTGGLFYGRIRSISQNYDSSSFTPSMNLGVEYPFARYFTVYAGYRASTQIHSVSTDGVNIGFKVF